jgi:hypothetical protein
MKSNACDPDTVDIDLVIDVEAVELEECPTQPALPHTHRGPREEPQTKLEFAPRAPARSSSISAEPSLERRTPQDPPRIDSSEAAASTADAGLRSIDDSSSTRVPPRSSPMKAPAASAAPAQRRSERSEEPRTQVISPELVELARSLYPAALKASATPAPNPTAQSSPAPKTTLPATSSIATESGSSQPAAAQAPTLGAHRAATPRSRTPKTRTAPSLRKRRAAALLAGCLVVFALGAVWLWRSQLQAVLSPPAAVVRLAAALLPVKPAPLGEAAQQRASPEVPVELNVEPGQRLASPERAVVSSAEATGQQLPAPERPVELEASPTQRTAAPDSDSPAARLVALGLVALEKQAVDQLVANEYRAAHALYNQLQAATPMRTEYALMTKLLERRLRADCGVGARCP